MTEEISDDAKVVLSYYDCLLRNADVKLLRGRHWLNDAIIGFYFEYLERSIDKECQKQIKLVSPELTQLLKMLEPYNYLPILNSTITNETDFIFFPFNNCDKVDDSGGSHWSLLIYSKAERQCFHLDSLSECNSMQARKFACKIMEYLLNIKIGSFKEVKCPQQINGYDCGIYVLCYAKIILEHLKCHSKIEECDLTQAGTSVNNKRLELLELIEKLK